MKIFRFMSKLEFSKYLAGEILTNSRKHEAKTSSIGFCFLDLDKYDPIEAMRFLYGVVSMDVCVVFETNKSLKKADGIYAKPLPKDAKIGLEDILELLEDAMRGFKNIEKIKVEEYCTTEYSKDEFKLIKYSYDLAEPYFRKDKIKWEE